MTGAANPRDGEKTGMDQKMIVVSCQLRRHVHSTILLSMGVSQPLLYQPLDKRLPEGPLSLKILPPSTPSAPRAMSSGGKAEATARDRDWKSQRDPATQNPTTGSSSNREGGSYSPETLRSRLSEKDISRSLPQAPPNSYRPDPPRQDDDRDSHRKRTLSGMSYPTSVCS
jgi:hypothetical protein